MNSQQEQRNWKKKLFTIIFEADTRAGKNFDLALLVFILISLALVMLQSIPSVNDRYGPSLNKVEWIITILFSIEYLLRIIAVRRPVKYITSFYGMVDLLAILPTYISLIFPASHFLLVIRVLRLMRIFRILKLSQFVREGNAIVQAMKASARRIGIFLAFVLLLSVVLGALVYVVEGRVNDKFSSIPQSIYWAIVTITTVGYGDISPITPAGKIVASLIMLLGYAILAVPTGIVTVEMSKTFKKEDKHSQACPNCAAYGHDPDARFCKYCGSEL
ncbi:ion transporter [Flavihumibacter stibioxidans]|uniref:Ion transporter n=1 Tax=Flavihumibacter stibioxidans TaxID=1834163 RepID=A0ABR7M8V2_9BACT|nr:ion transporter [Flavihumibacter stibioxidans]MBC6491443.1 ion transporter [Flavihumibacter stibioxidans]